MILVHMSVDRWANFVRVEGLVVRIGASRWLKFHHGLQVVSLLVARRALVNVWPHIHLVSKAYHLASNCCTWHNLTIEIQLTRWDACIFVRWKNSGCMLSGLPSSGWLLPRLVPSDYLVSHVILKHASTANLWSIILMRQEGWCHASRVLLVKLVKVWDLLIVVVNRGVDRTWTSHMSLRRF